MDKNDEIDLVDYVKVIIKKKWVIIGITLGALVVAGILTQIKPPTYKISAVLEIGKIGTVSLDTPIQLQEKVNQDSYDTLLQQKLGIENVPRIEVSAPKDTNLLIMKVNAEHPEEGKKILEGLSDLIIEEHNKFFQGQKKFIENEIKKEEAKIAIIEDSKDFPELQYLYVEHLLRIDELKNNLATAIPTQLIKVPSESIDSQNILIRLFIAGLLGVFIGILVAFFQEFLDRNKEKLKSD